jgi:hypothetical protein
MKKIRNIVDNYLNYAFIIDLIIMTLIWIINNLSLIEIKYLDINNYIDILSNIICAAISLAGFILASLTIIVAIRSNIANKHPEHAKNPLELFFSIGTFTTIVKVFKISIIELIICFIVSYSIWLISKNLSLEIINKIVILLIYLMSLSTIRSLFVLFLLIDSENKC